MTKTNPYDDNQAKASEHLRLALSYLAKHEIPHSPLNYRLGYDCVSGRNEELRLALEELICQSATLSEDSLWKLYRSFFMQDDVALEAIRNELKRVIVSLQGEFEHVGGSFSNYANSLNCFAKILDTSTPPNMMLTGVEKVIEETRTMERSQLHLESQVSSILAEVNTLRKELAQVREESQTDGLTGVSNRKAFDAALEHSIHTARQKKTPFCVLLGDIDQFKEFNDTHGHLIGDKVLRFVATTLQRSIKGKDMVARYGGEEFAIILPQTNLDGAYAVAEQIRNSVATGRLKKKSNREAFGRVTISIGVTQFYASDISSDLIERADRALYRAKSKGRNRVEKAA